MDDIDPRYLAPTAIIDSGSAPVRAFAREAAGGETDPVRMQPSPAVIATIRKPEGVSRLARGALRRAATPGGDATRLARKQHRALHQGATPAFGCAERVAAVAATARAGGL